MPTDSLPAGTTRSFSAVDVENVGSSWSSGPLAGVLHYKGLTALLILAGLFAVLAFAEPNFLSERALTIMRVRSRS